MVWICPPKFTCWKRNPQDNSVGRWGFVRGTGLLLISGMDLIKNRYFKFSLILASVSLIILLAIVSCYDTGERPLPDMFSPSWAFQPPKPWVEYISITPNWSSLWYPVTAGINELKYQLTKFIRYKQIFTEHHLLRGRKQYILDTGDVVMTETQEEPAHSQWIK
jgi:hypothetical protein